MGLLPAERGLTKKCATCERRLTLDHFYIRAKKLTRDGRWYRMSRCGMCFAEATRIKNVDITVKRQRDRARNRALRRLAHMTPELFEPLYAEELAREGLT